jgi:hypothetical protein
MRTVSVQEATRCVVEMNLAAGDARKSIRLAGNSPRLFEIASF